MQMAFKYQTIQQSDSFQLSEYRIFPVFRSPLNVDKDTFWEQRTSYGGLERIQSNAYIEYFLKPWDGRRSKIGDQLDIILEEDFHDTTERKHDIYNEALGKSKSNKQKNLPRCTTLWCTPKLFYIKYFFIFYF